MIEPDLNGLKKTLAGMLGADPLAEQRAERRSYYLSDRDGRESAAAFVAWVNGLQAEPSPRSARSERRSHAVQRTLDHR